MFLNHPSIFPTVLRSPAAPPPAPSRAEFLLGDAYESLPSP